MIITKHQLRKIIQEALCLVIEDKSGKGKCPPDGCVQRRAKGWVIISNDTGKCWGRSKKKAGTCTYYTSEEKAKNALKAFHA